MSFSNVPGVTILTPYIDYWNWPCIAGESFAPALTNASYQLVGVWPAIQCNAGGNIDWPVLPRYRKSTGTFETITLEFGIAGVSLGAVGWGSYFQFRGGLFDITLAISNNGIGSSSVNPYCNGYATTGSGAIPNGALTPTNFKMVVPATGKVEWYMDGSLLGTMVSDPGTAFRSLALKPSFVCQGASSGVYAVTGLTVTYG